MMLTILVPLMAIAGLLLLQFAPGIRRRTATREERRRIARVCAALADELAVLHQRRVMPDRLRRRYNVLDHVARHIWDNEDYQVVDSDPKHGLLVHIRDGSLARRGRTVVALLLVSCPSSQRNYVLFVPRDIPTAHEARAFTFGVSKKEFNPEIET